MIGLRIKQLMSQEKLDVMTLAKRLGKTKQAVYDMLEKTDVNTSLLRQLSPIFHVPISAFFEEEDAMYYSARTTGDYSPTVSGVNENVTVYATNDKETILSERVAHLTEKNEMLTAMIKEKERLITVLLKTTK